MNNEKKSTRYILQRLLLLVRHLWLRIAGAVLFAVAGYVLTLVIPALLVDWALHAVAQQSIPLWYVGILLVAAVGRGVCRYAEHYFGHDVAFRVLADCRVLVFGKLCRLAPSHLDSHDNGTLFKIIGEDIEALEVFFAHTLPPVATGLVSFVLVGTYFSSVHPALTVIAAVAYAVLVGVLPVLYANRLDGLLRHQNAQRTAYSQFFLESLKGMGDLVQYQVLSQRLEQLRHKSVAVTADEQRVAQLQMRQTTAMYAVVALFVALFTIVALGSTTGAPVHRIVAVVVFCSSFAPFLELSRLPLGLKRALNAGRNVLAILDQSEPLDDGVQQSNTFGDVALEHVGFAYPQRDKEPVLQDVTVRFEARRHIIGLVGSSGSGKSTVLKLLMRWYDPQFGCTTLNGCDVRQIERRHVQQHFAYVPQEPHLFAQTVRENLIFTNHTADDERIWFVLAQCQLADKIRQLPQQLDTVLRMDQQQFSAGEIQRLALARAFLKDAEAYVFDEPTSNLDSLNEAAFLHIVRQHCAGMVLLVSHRASTVACADVVYEAAAGVFVNKKGGSR